MYILPSELTHKSTILWLANKVQYNISSQLGIVSSLLKYASRYVIYHLLKNVFITKKTLSGLANEVGGSAIRAGSVGWLGGWVVGWLGRCVMGLGNAFRA